VYFQQLGLKDLFVSNEIFTFAPPKMVFSAEENLLCRI
jgi:hypothetical protein